MSYCSKKNKLNKAFSLIELLVVVIIIGSLSALLLPNFMSARERARDTQRKNDLKQIQKALEMYKQDQNPPAYPTAVSNRFGASCGGVFGPASSPYLNKIPCDPSTNERYSYTVNNTNLTYTLCACLENEADSDGVSGDCSIQYTCGSSANRKKFIVTQP